MAKPVQACRAAAVTVMHVQVGTHCLRMEVVDAGQRRRDQPPAGSEPARAEIPIFSSSQRKCSIEASDLVEAGTRHYKII